MKVPAPKKTKFRTAPWELMGCHHSAAASEPKVKRLVVENLAGETVALDVASVSTIGEVKELLEHATGIPVKSQRLLLGLQELDIHDIVPTKNVTLVRTKSKEGEPYVRTKSKAEFEQREKQREHMMRKIREWSIPVREEESLKQIIRQQRSIPREEVIPSPVVWDAHRWDMQIGGPAESLATCKCIYHVPSFASAVARAAFGPNGDWCEACDQQQNINNLIAAGWI